MGAVELSVVRFMCIGLMDAAIAGIRRISLPFIGIIRMAPARALPVAASYRLTPSMCRNNRDAQLLCVRAGRAAEAQSHMMGWRHR